MRKLNIAFLGDVARGAFMASCGVALFAIAYTAYTPEPAKAVPAPTSAGTGTGAAPCATVPAPDTLNGTRGSADCFIPGDASRPTAVQAANVTTDANGNWTVTFARPFTSSTPIIVPLPVNTGTLPMLCNTATRSASGATGRCWQSTATTLPGTVAGLAGLIVSPFGTSAANAAVTVIGREPTQ